MQAARAQFSDGQIKNMMAIDAQRISDSAWMLHEVWSIPCMLVLCTVLLYQAIGVAAFTGFGVMAVLLPFNMYIARNWEELDKNIQESRDTRVKLLREVLNGVKIVKCLIAAPSTRQVHSVGYRATSNKRQPHLRGRVRGKWQIQSVVCYSQ